MKVVITAQGPGLDAPFETRFGRAPYFVVVDLDTMQVESYPNPAAGATGGAGVQAAQFVASLGVQAIITGSLGPNASAALMGTGITAYAGMGATVRDVLELFKKGQLPQIPFEGGMPGGPGFGGGFGRGGGRGWGRGQGGGWGRGQGRGWGRGGGRGGFGRGGW